MCMTTLSRGVTGGSQGGGAVFVPIGGCVCPQVHPHYMFPIKKAVNNSSVGFFTNFLPPLFFFFFFSTIRA